MELDLSSGKVTDLIAILSKNDDRSELEALGRTLDAPQLVALWQKAATLLRNNHDKLAALLVGIAPAVFSQALALLHEKELELLKSAAPSEPLLHHLTLHTHALEEAFTAISHRITTLEQQIESLQPQYLETKELDLFTHHIEELRAILHRLHNAVSRALSLAWSAARAELVDKLSALKDQCERCNRLVLGISNHEQEVASGLYLHIEEQLSRTFGQAGLDADALHDDDPAVEALAKLSIWYLDDFYEVGLLSRNVPLYTQWRDALSAAEERLALLGLHTVADVKKAWICSRPTLKTFLSKHSSSNALG